MYKSESRLTNQFQPILDLYWGTCANHLARYCAKHRTLL